MNKMKYCKKCLSTNLRPNSSMNKDGICISCEFYDDNIDTKHTQKLKMHKNKIADHKKRKQKNSDYDCIVGVSAGKDSTRQAHWVRDRLGLRPLLVCAAYPPKQMTQIGADNISNLIKMGFDMIVATPAPQTSAQLSLESFRRFGNLLKSTEMSLFFTVPRLAVELGVDMIFWGENPALQVGDSAALGIDEFDGNSLRNLNTITEGGTKWICDFVDKKYLSEHYGYPQSIQFEKKKIDIFYLGPAWDDWSNESNAIYASLQGLSMRPNEEHITADLSNASMLDEEFVAINLMLKYYKFGFGRATDQINEKIRNRLISREEGIKIVERYDGVCGEQIIENYCRYVNITTKEFWDITNKWVNQDIFDIQNGTKPIKKFEVGIDYEG